MRITDETIDGVVLVALEGNLDSGTSTAALEHLNALVDAGTRRIVLDLAATDFVSSAGLRVLLATTKRLRDGGGALRVCGLNATVREVFEISGFNTILDVFPSRDEAVADFADA